MRLTLFICVLLSVTSLAHCQVSSPRLPSDFSGELLRNSDGQAVLFNSDEMKRRATHKADLVGFIKQADFKSTVLVDVLVGATGEVVCAKALFGIPMARKPVENAIQFWRFEPANLGGKPVAYLGRLEISLCNTNCGEEPFGVTLLK